MAVVDGVEAGQRGEEADVGLGDGVAHQVALAGQALLEPVQGGPEPVVGGVVGLLGAGEAAAVDAVVDLGEDPLVDGVDFLALVAPGTAPARRARWYSVHSVEKSRVICGKSLVTTCPLGYVHHGRDGDAAGVVGEAAEVVLLQALDAQHRIPAVRVQVEGPGAGVVGGAGQAERDGVLQAEQPAHDHGAVGPRAGAGGDQAVAAGLHRPGFGAVAEPAVRVADGAAGRPVRGTDGIGVGHDPVLDVAGVPVEFFAAVDVGALGAELCRIAGVAHASTISAGWLRWDGKVP